jgi:hypothetical protein
VKDSSLTTTESLYPFQRRPKGETTSLKKPTDAPAVLTFLCTSIVLKREGWVYKLSKGFALGRPWS